MGEPNAMYIKGKMPKEVVNTNEKSKSGEAAVIKMPPSLQIGKSLQGQVISINGNEIELLLHGDAKIKARLEQNMQVSLNQILNFEVKRSNHSLILRPLFENLGQDVNLVKALNEASMPATQNNLEMVQFLMQKGMPINKQALNELNRQMVQFPNLNGKVLVEMKELNIPITEVNISQYISYKGANHYIMDTFLQLSNSLQEGFTGLAQENNWVGVQETFSKFNQLFVEISPFHKKINQTQNTEVSNLKSKIGNELNHDNFKVNIEENKKVNLEENLKDNLNEIIKGPVMGDSKNPVLEHIELEKQIILSGEEQLQNSNKVGLKIATYLEKLNIPEVVITKLKEDSGDLQKTFLIIENLMQDKEWAPKLKSFFQSELFREGMQELLGERCLLEPKDFSEKEVVKESFERMKHEVDVLNRMSKEMGKTGEKLGKVATSLQNNLEFMNQLNQTFSYLQIPFKNGKENGNAELFVYAKKKTAIEEGETVSALLHLDMKNLGILDVHVKMDLGKVQTNFYLEDEASLDFISSHLSELDASIAKRGYEVNSSANILKEKKDTIEYLTKKVELEGNYMISNQSFDARA